MPYTKLREAGVEIGATVAGWLENDAPERLAEELLHLPYSKFVSLFEQHLVIYIAQDQRQTFLDVVTQFWVDPLAIAQVPRLSGPDARSNTLALAVNAQLPFTGLNYVRRSSCTYPPGWTILSVLNRTGPDSFGRLRTEIEATIRSRYDMPNDPDEFLWSFVKRQAENDRRIFIIIPGEVEESVLSRLHSEFPHLTLMLMAGDQMESLPAAVERLSPKLSPGREMEVYMQYHSAIGAANWDSKLAKAN
jgi:hypothetical protein